MVTCTRPPGNKLMNSEELYEWILRRLGAPFWDIELCQQHVRDAVEMAVRWFAAKKGVTKLLFIRVQPNVVEYQLDCEVDRVIDVAYETQKLDLSLIFSPFTLLEEKIPYDVFASGGFRRALLQLRAGAAIHRDGEARSERRVRVDRDQGR